MTGEAIPVVAEQSVDTGVLIVGAGPVGLLLAAELAHHGVPCVLTDRSVDPTSYPKMDITNGRTMELLRRLDLHERVREAGVGAEHRFDVVFATGLHGEEIGRWPLPSVDEARHIIRYVNDGSMPREPAQRCAQSLFEKLMRDHCDGNPLIDTRWGWRCEGVTQDDDGANVTFTDGAGAARDLRARWVVGCDGANSVVRRSMGISMEGNTGTASLAMVHFRSSDLNRLHRFGRFWHIYFTGGAVIISQDEGDTWTVHDLVSDDFTWDGVDPVTFLHRALGVPVEVDEVLITSRWNPNLLVADRYRSGRVFLAGDAAHQVIPTGGYGMNTGAGDAVDLGWKLAAVEQGWGGGALLDSYHLERHHVAEQNRDRSLRHALALLAWRGSGDRMTATIPEPGENESFGIELDYRLEGSPVVVPDGSPAPSWDAMVVTPSARPGHRAPSVFTQSGEAIQDRFGPGFTVLVLGEPSEETSAAVVGWFKERAPISGVPLVVVAESDPHLRTVYEADFVLIRPDGYVAWRANTVAGSADVDRILGTVTGRA